MKKVKSDLGKKDFDPDMVEAIAKGAVKLVGIDLAAASIKKDHRQEEEGLDGDISTETELSLYEVEADKDDWTHGFVGNVKFEMVGEFVGQIVVVVKFKVDEALVTALMEDWVDRVARMAMVVIDRNSEDKISRLAGLYEVCVLGGMINESFHEVPSVKA